MFSMLVLKRVIFLIRRKRRFVYPGLKKPYRLTLMIYLTIVPSQTLALFLSCLSGQLRGVARHNFKRRQLLPPLPKNGGPGVLPRIFFLEFCIAVGDFWYIFGERKQTFLSPEMRIRGIVDGKIFEFCIAEGELWYIFGEQKHTFLSPKTGVRSIVPGKMFEFCIAVGEFWYIFGERKQTFLSPKTGVWGIVTGKIFEFCIAVGEF